MTNCSRFLLAAVLMTSALLAATIPATPQPQRTIIAVLDVTPSFHPRAESVEKIKEVVRALGPGDEFILLILGGTLSLRESVFVQSVMPPAPPELLVSATNVRGFDENQRRLTALWVGARQKREKILQALERTWADRDTTPVFEMLQYLSHRLESGAASGDKYLLLFSDLKHDASGVKSVLPPKQPVAFQNVTVSALFVPWEANWAVRETAWRGWFNGSGAKGFTMLDEAKSRLVRLLPPNATPQSAPKSF